MRLGAVRALEDALAARGLLPEAARSRQIDAITQEAERALPRSGLAAAGVPGHATVEVLGLQLDEILHHGGGPS